MDLETNPLEKDASEDRLLAVVAGATAEAARRAGAHLACRPGCTECCIGPFPITALDAERLREGLAGLEVSEAVRAERVRERAGRAASLLRRDFPGDPATGVLDEDEGQRDAFFVTHAAMPCPALDPATGLCDLYAHRPLSCRTYGPPMTIEGTALPPCRLCFTKARPDEVAACRVSLSCASLEDPLTRAAEARTGMHGETLIAFALAR